MEHSGCRRGYVKNYFKTLSQPAEKQGFYSHQYHGLTLGIATSLIVFYVLDELSYDRYHEKADRIYRINNDVRFGGNEKRCLLPRGRGPGDEGALPEVSRRSADECGSIG